VFHSLDLLDRFHLVVPHVATPEVVSACAVAGAPVEAALERVAEALGADLLDFVACFRVTPASGEA